MTERKNTMLQEWEFFIAALMFYTRIPMPANSQHSEIILNKSRKYFPLIGIIIGSIGALTLFLFQLFLPLSVSVAISMISTIFATGAFHEDGFADTCDGLGGGWSKEQALTIMKDSRVGSYALVGMSLLLLLKFTSLFELAQLSLPLLLLVYINAHGISRLLSSCAIEQLNYVQDINNSKVKPITTVRFSHTELGYSALFILPSFGLLLTWQWAFIWLLPISYLAYAGLCQYFKQRIGGYTGDCLGAIQQVTEVIFYIATLALLTV